MEAGQASLLLVKFDTAKAQTAHDGGRCVDTRASANVERGGDEPVPWHGQVPVSK